MLDFIERMRKKPESARKRFAITVSAIITGIIFLVWLSVVGVRFSEYKESNTNQPVFDPETTQDIDDIRNKLSNILNSSKDELKKLENLQTETVFEKVSSTTGTHERSLEADFFKDF